MNVHSGSEFQIPRQVTIVDDDPEYLDYLSEYLRARGCVVEAYRDGAEFLAAQDRNQNSDFFIIDLMLPGMDGMDLVSMIRERRPEAGVLIVSGKLGPDSFNTGLASGADMYLMKPVRFDQIVYAMGSVSRRLAAQTKTASPQWELTGRTLSDGFHARVELTPLECRMLRVLAKNQGTPFSRETLQHMAQARGSAVGRSLDAAVYRLRRKIEQASPFPAPFKTVHGQGYVLTASITIEL